MELIDLGLYNPNHKKILEDQAMILAYTRVSI